MSRSSPALFYVLAVSQTAHFAEHLAQMTQLHLLGRTGLDARGVVSTLDVEWVHLAWNSWGILAAALLVYHFRDNRWLWLTAVIATWHLIKHVYIMSVYVDTGVAGTPGLLADGGRIGGGLPLTRAGHLSPNVSALAWTTDRTADDGANARRLRCGAMISSCSGRASSSRRWAPIRRTETTPSYSGLQASQSRLRCC